MTRSTPISVERFFELSLVGFVASGYLAVVSSGYLDVPTAALTAGGLLLRMLAVMGVVRLDLSSRTQAVVTAAYIGFYPLDYLYISGEFLAATVHLVFFLAVMKILTAKSHRDHIFVAVIAFLELLAAAVLSSNLNFFLSLALFLVSGVAAFSSAEIRRAARKPGVVAKRGIENFQWRLGALTLSISLGILTLTGGLFFLLPRTAQAAFRHLVPQHYRIPGFSNEVTLGETGVIQQRNTPVMHVRVNSSDPPGDLKWRGAALSHFDGRRWFNPTSAGERLPVQEGLLRIAENRRPPQEAGHRLNYEVQLHAVASDALFFAGAPEFLQINQPLVVRTATDSYRVPLATSDGLRYAAWGYSDARDLDPDAPEGPAPAAIQGTYLQLPPLDPRIPALARQVSAPLKTDEAKAHALEKYLRTSYGYTTDLLPETVPDPLAHFLFERRKGHCEYFASALAVMLRSVGIPARIANGFQSGVLNPVSGWFVIRASDAHSWVEAWIQGRGWTAFDATPPAPEPPAFSVWARMGFYIDAAETFWDEWVLNYDLDRQLTLASRMESSGRNLSSHWFDHLRANLFLFKRGAIEAAKRHGAPAVALLAALAALWLAVPRAREWWRTRERLIEAQRGGGRPSDATLLYARMLAVMARRGFEKPAWLTPAEFVRVLPASNASALVAEFTDAYNSLRFGGVQSAGPKMVELLRRFEEVRA